MAGIICMAVPGHSPPGALASRPSRPFPASALAGPPASPFLSLKRLVEHTWMPLLICPPPHPGQWAALCFTDALGDDPAPGQP